jgi:signal transduction histidine kinase
MPDSKINSQIAVARIDGLLNKVFVIALALLMADVVQNAVRQFEYLHPGWFFVTLSALVACTVGAILAAYKFGNARYWYRALAIIVLFTMLTWNFQMNDNQVLPADYKPWIWWALGPVTVGVAGAWSRKWVYLSLALGPLVWFIVATAPEGGGATISLAAQDSFYTLFFTTVLTVMALVLKDRARDVDAAEDLARAALLERTRADVMKRQRSIFNSILHDKVLATLALAANAKSTPARKEARAAAEDAIGRLNREVERTANPPENVNLAVVAQPLLEGLQRGAPDFNVSSIGSSTAEIPFQVAAAIYEAALLAAKNSVTHAPSATERIIRIRISARGLKVVVKDNGRGFRVSNIHKTALGVRWTMFRRLESLGVKPSLESKPGAGTTWIFEWSS